MKKSVLQEVRFSLYIAFIINGIFIQWIAPYNYKCDFTDEKCFACGLRTAVNLILNGQFREAYHSNKLIIVIVLMVIIMMADVGFYIYKRAMQKVQYNE